MRPRQVIPDAGTGVPGQGSSRLQVGEFRLGVATVVQVVPLAKNHLCPGVTDSEELLVNGSAGTSLQRWPVDAPGVLG
ncbi:hypothetical protein ACFYR1_46990 [Streptomyces canus]|uniref:hypothetical protein n=1 Tax=Streptomyces canus TaxID=58343 RepID=UPI0036CB44C4